MSFFRKSCLMSFSTDWEDLMKTVTALRLEACSSKSMHTIHYFGFSYIKVKLFDFETYYSTGGKCIQGRGLKMFDADITVIIMDDICRLIDKLIISHKINSRLCTVKL